MSPTQFKQFKTLIHTQRLSASNEAADVFSIFKNDLEGELSILILHNYRGSINNEILGKIKQLNLEEVDFCYFRGLNSLLRAIKEDRFKYHNLNSVKKYLLVACNNQAFRFLEKKKNSLLPFSTKEFMESFASEEDNYEEIMEKENMLKAKDDALNKISTVCKKMIQKFFLDKMSHAKIIEEIPQLKNVKNSSAKFKRCLNKLRILAVEILKKNEYTKS